MKALAYQEEVRAAREASKQQEPIVVKKQQSGAAGSSHQEPIVVKKQHSDGAKRAYYGKQADDVKAKRCHHRCTCQTELRCI